VRRHPPRSRHGNGGALVAARVIRSRRPLLVPEWRGRSATSPGVHGSGILSTSASARGARTDGGMPQPRLVLTGVRRYGPDDLAWRRISASGWPWRSTAPAVRSQRHIAMTLQASLLPPGLPDIPASRSRPATAPPAGARSRRDFYDVFAVGEGAWRSPSGTSPARGGGGVAPRPSQVHVRAAAREHRKPREILLRTQRGRDRRASDQSLPHHTPRRLATAAEMDCDSRWPAAVILLPPCAARRQDVERVPGRARSSASCLRPETAGEGHVAERSAIAFLHRQDITDVLRAPRHFVRSASLPSSAMREPWSRGDASTLGNPSMALQDGSPQTTSRCRAQVVGPGP